MGVELFHADRQTDMPKLTVAFRNFAKAPKKKKKNARQWIGIHHTQGTDK